MSYKVHGIDCACTDVVGDENCVKNALEQTSTQTALAEKRKKEETEIPGGWRVDALVD